MQTIKKGQISETAESDFANTAKQPANTAESYDLMNEPFKAPQDPSDKPLPINRESNSSVASTNLASWKSTSSGRGPPPPGKGNRPMSRDERFSVSETYPPKAPYYRDSASWSESALSSRFDDLDNRERSSSGYDKLNPTGCTFEDTVDSETVIIYGDTMLEEDDSVGKAQSCLKKEESGGNEAVKPEYPIDIQRLYENSLPLSLNDAKKTYASIVKSPIVSSPTFLEFLSRFKFYGRAVCRIGSVQVEFQNLSKEEAKGFLEILERDNNIPRALLHSLIPMQLNLPELKKMDSMAVGLKRRNIFKTYHQINCYTFLDVVRVKIKTPSTKLYTICEKISKCLNDLRDSMWEIASKFRVMILALSPQCQPVDLREVYGFASQEEKEVWLEGLQSTIRKDSFLCNFLTENQTLQSPQSDCNAYFLLFSFDKTCRSYALKQTFVCLQLFDVPFEQTKELESPPLSVLHKSEYESEVRAHFPKYVRLTAEIWDSRDKRDVDLTLKRFRQKWLEFLRAKFLEYYYSGIISAEGENMNKYIYLVGEGDWNGTYYTKEEEAEEMAINDSNIGFPPVFFIVRVGEWVNPIDPLPSPELYDLLLSSPLPTVTPEKSMFTFGSHDIPFFPNCELHSAAGHQTNTLVAFDSGNPLQFLACRQLYDSEYISFGNGKFIVRVSIDRNEEKRVKGDYEPLLPDSRNIIQKDNNFCLLGNKSLPQLRLALFLGFDGHYLVPDKFAEDIYNKLREGSTSESLTTSSSISSLQQFDGK